MAENQADVPARREKSVDIGALREANSSPSSLNSYLIRNLYPNDDSPLSLAGFVQECLCQSDGLLQSLHGCITGDEFWSFGNSCFARDLVASLQTFSMEAQLFPQEVMRFMGIADHSIFCFTNKELPHFEVIAPTLPSTATETPASQCECAICLDDMTHVVVARLRCGHVFHPHCLNEWFRRSLRCPLCLTDFTARVQEIDGVGALPGTGAPEGEDEDEDEGDLIL
eukprot:gnl/Trimastix_PCT/3614.p1 GENE.gnl/Trimastix_PCT/3614~~gnl/Trimastix_PCT/3614.p1  ORF type:complete len:226 (-),score=18.11 gnl/Trimastix_PCT/3614:75-752(-)